MAELDLYSVNEIPADNFEPVKKNMIFPVVVLILGIAGTIFFSFNSNRAKVNKSFAAWLKKNKPNT